MSPTNHLPIFSRLRSYLISLRNSNQINVNNKERNYLSAICSMFAVATLVVSLSDHRWFWLKGGMCNSKNLGLNMFFSIGKLFLLRKPIPWDSSAPLNNIYQFKSNDYTELTGCVDTHSILILRLMITLICLVIISSTIGFLVDALGPMKYGLKFMRRYAFWHILSVFLCTIVIGLCFYVSELIYNIQDKTRLKIGKKVEVQFGIAYYLLVISNGLLLFAVAFTLLRKYPTNEEEHFERLIDDWSRREESLFIQRSLPAAVSTIPTNDPPPEYHSEDDFVLV